MSIYASGHSKDDSKEWKTSARATFLLNDTTVEQTTSSGIVCSEESPAPKIRLLASQKNLPSLRAIVSWTWKRYYRPFSFLSSVPHPAARQVGIPSTTGTPPVAYILVGKIWNDFNSDDASCSHPGGVILKQLLGDLCCVSFFFWLAAFCVRITFLSYFISLFCYAFFPYLIGEDGRTDARVDFRYKWFQDFEEFN